jgi:hypothetical protein
MRIAQGKKEPPMHPRLMFFEKPVQLFKLVHPAGKHQAGNQYPQILPIQPEPPDTPAFFQDLFQEMVGQFLPSFLFQKSISFSVRQEVAVKAQKNQQQDEVKIPCLFVQGESKIGAHHDERHKKE